MSSSNPEHHSLSLQNNHPPSIKEIVKKLSDLLKALSEAKDDPEKASRVVALLQPATKVVDSKPPTDKPNPLDEACKELKYLIRASDKLEEIKTDLSVPISILEHNVTDILAALNAKDYAKDLIERNLKVLSSTIIEILRIPLLHQASTISKAS